MKYFLRNYEGASHFYRVSTTPAKFPVLHVVIFPEVDHVMINTLSALQTEYKYHDSTETAFNDALTHARAVLFPESTVEIHLVESLEEVDEETLKNSDPVARGQGYKNALTDLVLGINNEEVDTENNFLYLLEL